MSRKILVLGSSGRLGSTFSKSIDFGASSELLLHSRKLGSHPNADLAERSGTFEMLNEIRPDVIINTVALAEIEACEKARIVLIYATF